MHENPQFLSAKGTTKKAEALELFVYPNSVLVVVRGGAIKYKLVVVLSRVLRSTMAGKGMQSSQRENPRQTITL